MCKCVEEGVITASGICITRSKAVRQRAIGGQALASPCIAPRASRRPRPSPRSFDRKPASPPISAKIQDSCLLPPMGTLSVPGSYFSPPRLCSICSSPQFSTSRVFVSAVIFCGISFPSHRARFFIVFGGLSPSKFWLFFSPRAPLCNVTTQQPYTARMK